MKDDRFEEKNEQGKTQSWDFRELQDGEEQRECLRRQRSERLQAEDGTEQAADRQESNTSGEDQGSEENLKDGAEEFAVRASDRADRESEEDDPNKDYEDVCFICRRPESKTGKMFRLPNHICVCNDCMHKTMDTVSQFDYQGMLNHPNMSDINSGKGFPKISFVNLADLQGDGGIPNKQKLKKRMPNRKLTSGISCRPIRSRRSWMNMWWGRNMPRR